MYAAAASASSSPRKLHSRPEPVTTLARANSSSSSNNETHHQIGDGRPNGAASTDPSITPQSDARYSVRRARAACPICGKVFFNLAEHAATCQAEEAPPKTLSKSAPSSVGATSSTIELAANKKKRAKTVASVAAAAAAASASLSPTSISTPASITNVPAASPGDTMRKKRASQLQVAPPIADDATLAYLRSNQHMPPPLPMTVPEDEANKNVIARERALLAAAASVASSFENATTMGDRPRAALELVEVEPGVTIMVSDVAFRDGQGQGLAFTLRSELVNMIAELHAVRESEAGVRAENDKLRASIEEIQSRAVQAHVDLTERLAREREALNAEATAEVKNEQKRLEKDLAQARAKVIEMEESFGVRLGEVREELSEATSDAAKVKTELEMALASITTLETASKAQESTIHALRQEVHTKDAELEDVRRDLDVAHAAAQVASVVAPDRGFLEYGSHVGVDGMGQDQMMMMEMAPPSSTSEVDEYLDMLRAWLTSHKNSIAISALVIFHNVKARADKLWKRLSENMEFRDIVLRYGGPKGIFMSEDEMTVYLGAPQQPSTSQQPHIRMDTMMMLAPLIVGGSGDDADDFGDLLGVAGDVHPRVLTSEEISLIERVSAWLEEKNGHATWVEFKETFSRFEGNQPDLTQIVAVAAANAPFFTTQSGDLVLTSMADSVLAALFSTYLASQGGFAPASKFAHFVETVPGVLQIRERLSVADSKPAALASKFPSKLHLWKEGELTMCCVAEDRTRLERERAERRRQEEERRTEDEARRVEREKAEGEERARNDWERRKTALTTAANSANVANLQSARAANGSGGVTIKNSASMNQQPPQTVTKPSKASRWATETTGAVLPPSSSSTATAYDPALQQQQHHATYPPYGDQHSSGHVPNNMYAGAPPSYDSNSSGQPQQMYPGTAPPPYAAPHYPGYQESHGGHHQPYDFNGNGTLYGQQPPPAGYYGHQQPAPMQSQPPPPGQFGMHGGGFGAPQPYPPPHPPQPSPPGKPPSLLHYASSGDRRN